MKKTALLLAGVSLFAATTKQIIKKEFDTNILPQIMSDLKKDSRSAIMIKVYTDKKGVTVKTYSIHQTYSNTDLFVKKGSYTLGYKYYNRYVFQTAHIKVTDFIKIINVKTDKDINKLFADNGAKLLQALKKEKQFIAVKGIEKIIKKKRLNDLKEFLKGVLTGKVPASCS